MPNDRSVHNCLRNLGSCSEQTKNRLRGAGLVEGDGITPLGSRVLTETCTEEDVEEMRRKIASWYCHGRTRSVPKSPIDCGDK
mgnify:FL=1